MYFPKSQIQTDLYTKGGEFINFKTLENYIGYYYQTSNGKKYSGKNPTDTPSFELLTSISNTDNLDTELETNNFWTSNFTQYKPNIDKTISKSPPKQTYPVVTDANYSLGEFQRYFLKKSNETKFLEISKADYNRYVDKVDSVPYELYIPTQISWALTGDKNQVYQVNKTTVEKTEREQSLYGFTQYFKDKFTQFYK